MLFKFFRILILQNTKCIFKLDFLLCIAGIILTNFQIRMEKLHFCYMYKNIFGTFLSLMKIQSNMVDQDFASTIAHMSAKGLVYACEQQIFVLMKIQSNMGDWKFVSAIAHICQQRDSHMHVNNIAHICQQRDSHMHVNNRSLYTCFKFCTLSCEGYVFS